jgi:hypothetical protein
MTSTGGNPLAVLCVRSLVKELGCHLLRRANLLWVAALVALLSFAACRHGVPVIDTAPQPLQADGTISGTVRGPEGTSPIDGRRVQVINVETGERLSTATNNAGGFTFKVKPGKYRVELTLLEGESLVKKPGVLTIDRSDVDAHADFVLGTPRISRPRAPRPVRSDDGLGAPIA